MIFNTPPKPNVSGNDSCTNESTPPRAEEGSGNPDRKTVGQRQHTKFRKALQNLWIFQY